MRVLWAVRVHVTCIDAEGQAASGPPRGREGGWRLTTYHSPTAGWALVSLTPGTLPPPRSRQPGHVVTICSHCLRSDRAAQGRPHGRDVWGTGAAEAPSGFASRHTVSTAKRQLRPEKSPGPPGALRVTCPPTHTSPPAPPAAKRNPLTVCAKFIAVSSGTQN